jgi:hypothetical protein
MAVSCEMTLPTVRVCVCVCVCVCVSVLAHETQVKANQVQLKEEPALPGICKRHLTLMASHPALAHRACTAAASRDMPGCCMCLRPLCCCCDASAECVTTSLTTPLLSMDVGPSSVPGVSACCCCCGCGCSEGCLVSAEVCVCVYACK